VCKGITPENFGKISITRNSVIASMLYRIDYIEQMGTGILRMKNAAKTANVAEPKFDLHDFFRVTFARNKSNDNELAIDSDRLAIENSDRTSAILKYLEQNGRGKNADFVKLLGLSPQRIRQILQDMIQNGLIEKHGEKRYAYYVVKK
jgi:ATP-dependent DNA helicase RecG